MTWVWFCVLRWDQIQQLKDEKGHELLSTANVQSFLQSCEEAKTQLQCQLSRLDPVDVGCSSFTLQTEEKNQTRALRDIQTLEAKITYLKSVAKMYGSDLDWLLLKVINYDAKILKSTVSKIWCSIKKHHFLLVKPCNFRFVILWGHKK